MIAFLQGKLAESKADQIWLDVGGVGYRVFVPTSVFGHLPAPGGELKLFTHLVVREDAFLLYGFPTAAEQELFELLLTIPGIGPKVALSVLSTVSPEQLRRAIAGEDAEALERIPGIGKKTAQRLVLELKGKIDKLLPAAAGEASPAAARSTHEAVAALTVLGYGQAEINRALRLAQADGSDSTEALIRQALQYLQGD